MQQGSVNSLESKPLLEGDITSDTTSDLDINENVKVYKKRWYILFMFVLLCIGQGIIYNTWAPIQSTARAVYKWDNYMIDLMPALGCIVPCFTIVPLGWLMDVKGLRVAVLFTAGSQGLGFILRCLPTGGNMKIMTVLIGLSQVFGAIPSPIPLSGGVLVSATWFPAHERTFSTAIVFAGAFIGQALSFIVGPLAVTDVGSITYSDLNSTQRDFYLGQLNKLLYIEAGAFTLLFITVLIYYPAKPVLPPTRSSRVQRVDTKEGLKCLLKNGNFVLLAVLYGASYGVYSGWNSVLGQNLFQFGLGQNFAGWLGFIAVVTGGFSGIVFSIIAGRFVGHLKDFLMVLMTFATLSILLVSFIFTKVIPFSKVLMCVVFGATGFFLNGALPFFFELAAEITFPVAEGITTSVVKFTDYFLQAIFLSVSMGQLGAKWMTWVTMASCATSTVFLFFVKETYNRLNLDILARKQDISPT